MKDLIIVQIGSKPVKKTDKNFTVFLNDAVNHIFETHKGFGMDLTTVLAQRWFVQVVAKNTAAMQKINSILQDEAHELHWVAKDLELEENGQHFKRGLALSFDTIMKYLRDLGVVEYKDQMVSDHTNNSAGTVYVIRFLD